MQNNRAISFDDRTIITTIIDNYNSQEQLLLAKLFFSAFNLTFPDLYNEWKNLSVSLDSTEHRNWIVMATGGA